MKQFGYIPTDVKTHKRFDNLLAKRQGSPLFADLAPHLKGSGAKKLSMPFRSVERFAPGAFDQEAQEGPDCTSHAARSAADTPRAVEIDIKGQPEEWVARGATEHIYAYRGFNGPGMSPGRATTMLLKYGHLVRRKYPFADLSKYTFSIGHELGRSGPTREMLEECGKHKFRYQARITSVEQARDAIANGYGVFGGSQYGSDGVRDKRGVWSFNDSWNHSLFWGLADETGDDLFFGPMQTWGPHWGAKGPMPWFGEIPKGSGLMPSRDAEWCIKNGEFYAIGDFDGFPARDLPDYGATQFFGS